MKKFYNEPEMNISLFAQADIVTTSGEEPTPAPVGETAVVKADAALAEATTKITLTW
ncbi:MAG: hypothetical protein ACI38A_04085 [Candidatus Ornithomonoglobus sp.]